MSALDPRDVDVPGLIAILLLGLGLLDLFRNAVPGVLFYVGFAVVLPLVGILFDDEREDTSEPTPDPEPDPLEELRRRYAEDEIDEAEFERRVERLLETQDEHAATEYVERQRAARERTDDDRTAEETGTDRGSA